MLSRLDILLPSCQYLHGTVAYKVIQVQYMTTARYTRRHSGYICVACTDHTLQAFTEEHNININLMAQISMQ